MLNTIARNTKYVVIASASRSVMTESLNKVRHSMAFTMVSGTPGVKSVSPVTGYYAEEGQQGAYEQSMAIAVSTEDALKSMVNLFCGCYEQDCVLVWNQKTDSVWLVNQKDGMFCKLGDKGLRIAGSFDRMIIDNLSYDAFTVDGNGNIWVVA